VRKTRGLAGEGDVAAVNDEVRSVVNDFISALAGVGHFNVRRLSSSQAWYVSQIMILEEYAETLFAVKSREMEWPARFFIITACNPESSGERREDKEAQLRLRKDLNRLGGSMQKLTGISPDWAHEEKSFAVCGIEDARMLELGREFRQNAIFLVEGDDLSVVSCGGAEQLTLGSFRERLRLRSDRPAYSIYVVRLDEGVLTKKKFRKANPGYAEGKPCYYVGMTSQTPEERFVQHKSKHRAAAKWVHKYGLHLAKKKFKNIPLLSREEAIEREVSHAEALRRKGFGVWQK